MKLNHGNSQSNFYFIEKYKLLKKSDKILEIGSGKGNTLSKLKNKGYKIQGCEVNDNYISFVKKNFNINLKKITSTKLPYKDNSFDLVVSFDVLEHIPDTDLHLKEVHRVLKEGGKYIFSTPNKFLDIPFQIVRFKSFNRYKDFHCSLQSYFSLIKRLEDNGFNYKFYKVPVKTDFMMSKAKKYLGSFFYKVIEFLPIDNLPIPLKTNFYVVAEKNINA